MNNPVAAGGVGVVEQTQTRDQIALVMLTNGSEEQRQEAVEYISGRLRYANASDLEACQAHYIDLLDKLAEAHNTQLRRATAAQAEADRLREVLAADLELDAANHALRTTDPQSEDAETMSAMRAHRGRCAKRRAAAIDAAKTEQERGE